MRECGGSGGLFLFPESTRHWSRAAYLISHEENPNLQLLLIRVKRSRPTNSYWTPKKPPSLSLSLQFLRLSLNLDLGVRQGRGCVAWGLDGPCCCPPPPNTHTLFPAHHLHLIGVGGNVLTKLRLGSTPVFCQGKLDWTLITTP